MFEHEMQPVQCCPGRAGGQVGFGLFTSQCETRRALVHRSSSILALAPCRWAGCRTVVGPGPSGPLNEKHDRSSAELDRFPNSATGRDDCPEAVSSNAF